MKKLWISLILALALVLALGVTAQAAGAKDVLDFGTCGAEGENLTWTLDEEGTLSISGTGAMADYSASAGGPWGQSVMAVEISTTVQAARNLPITMSQMERGEVSSSWSDLLRFSSLSSFMVRMGTISIYR